MSTTSLRATSVEAGLTTLPLVLSSLGTKGLSISSSVSISVVETCVKLLEAEEGRVLVAAVPSLTADTLTPAVACWAAPCDSVERGVEVATGVVSCGAPVVEVTKWNFPLASSKLQNNM